MTNDFKKIFNSFGAAYPRYNIFRDFCAMAAISLSNSMKAFQPPAIVAKREEEYAQIKAKYKVDVHNKFPQLLAATVEALGAKPEQDFLGNMFMELDLGNKLAGQFFSPYSISALMVKSTIPTLLEGLKTKPYVTMSDPTVGGGGMMIATFNGIREAGENPQTRCLFFGADIDLDVLRMAYTQCALLGMCGHFIHGDSLKLEQWSTWTTPMYYMNWQRFVEPKEPTADESADAPKNVFELMEGLEHEHD